MTTRELIAFEMEHFKKGWGRTLDFRKLNAANVDNCMKHALSDALNQGARRGKVKYLPIISTILNAFRNDFFEIASGKTIINNEASFERVFNKLKDKFLALLNSNNLSILAKFGFAQKFINMTFKYLYCFDDCLKSNLRFCHLPLDQYTIDWYKTIGTKTITNRFKKINFAWANMDETLYWDIQNDINQALSTGINYRISCTDPTKSILLPDNRIEVEFIVWMQQQLNDVYKKSLSKLKDYYDRLGIKEI
jgi:hypothetical protein